MNFLRPNVPNTRSSGHDPWAALDNFIISRLTTLRGRLVFFFLLVVVVVVVSCRIYTGEIGDVTVAGGTKVNNSCVKKASEGSEVSQRLYSSQYYYRYIYFEDSSRGT